MNKLSRILNKHEVNAYVADNYVYTLKTHIDAANSFHTMSGNSIEDDLEDSGVSALNGTLDINMNLYKVLTCEYTLEVKSVEEFEEIKDLIRDILRNSKDLVSLLLNFRDEVFKRFKTGCFVSGELEEVIRDLNHLR